MAGTNKTALAASLPFRIVEELGIGCGYERSFKLTKGKILANRYLLGIDTGDVTRRQLLDACRQLHMPQNLLKEFLDGLPAADTVLLGFEDDAEAGSIYKVYLEYWDLLRKKLLTGNVPREAHLLHKGFKWSIDAPDNHVVTWYRCLPYLETDAIQPHIAAIYRGLPDARGLQAICAIIDVVRQRQPELRYLFVEVSEPGNPRKSFDLNLYPAGMRVGQIVDPIRNIAGALDVPADKFHRLMAMIQDKPLGHISGGIARTGGEYFTVYYENGEAK